MIVGWRLEVDSCLVGRIPSDIDEDREVEVKKILVRYQALSLSPLSRVEWAPTHTSHAYNVLVFFNLPAPQPPSYSPKAESTPPPTNNTVPKTQLNLLFHVKMEMSHIGNSTRYRHYFRFLQIVLYPMVMLVPKMMMTMLLCLLLLPLLWLLLLL